MQWGTGRALPGTVSGDGAATVVLEDPGHLAPLLASDLVGPHSTVFVPGGAPDATDGGPLVVGYEGSLSEPGGDLSLDDSFFLQTQDYATSAYMSVIGATLVRVIEEADFEAFLADADLAHAEGEFPSFATDPAVQLADLCALGAGPGGDGPWTRLHVGRDGAVSVSPGGLRLGALADGFAALASEWDRAAAGSVPLGAVVPEDVRARALEERPWLGRYLAALDAVRELRARGATGIRVSGFGGRLLPALPVNDDGDVPLLLWTDDSAYLHADGRTFQISRAAGELAEALLVCGSPASAAAYADRDRLAQVADLFAGAGVPLVAAHLVGARQ